SPCACPETRAGWRRASTRRTRAARRPRARPRGCRAAGRGRRAAPPEAAACAGRTGRSRRRRAAPARAVSTPGPRRRSRRRRCGVVRLSYPEHVFAERNPGSVALHSLAEDRPPESWTWGRLQAETARVQAGLRRLGVGPGDRVAAFLPNTPRTLAAFRATTSLGAVWTCCSPDFGARTVVDRFAQIEPT